MTPNNHNPTPRIGNTVGGIQGITGKRTIGSSSRRMSYGNRNSVPATAPGFRATGWCLIQHTGYAPVVMSCKKNAGRSSEPCRTADKSGRSNCHEPAHFV